MIPETRLPPSIESREAKEYLTTLVSEAGEILMRRFKSSDPVSIQKEGVDFTTEVDEEVDKFLRNRLQSHYPNSSFLTEETAPSDYGELRTVDNLWVIDPLDGTTNFSRGHPNFAISIALVDQGRPRLAAVYLPVTKQLYWAQEDENLAFLNGEPIQVSRIKELREAVIGCDWGWDLQKRKNVWEWVGKLLPHVRVFKSMGSAAPDLASLAEGRIDAYLHSGIKPWDVAAASLLIEKAGGRVTTPDGEEWNIFHPDIFASNGILHSKILQLIR